MCSPGWKPASEQYLEYMTDPGRALPCHPGQPGGLGRRSGGRLDNGYFVDMQKLYMGEGRQARVNVCPSLL